MLICRMRPASFQCLQSKPTRTSQASFSSMTGRKRQDSCVAMSQDSLSEHSLHNHVDVLARQKRPHAGADCGKEKAKRRKPSLIGRDRRISGFHLLADVLSPASPFSSCILLLDQRVAPGQLERITETQEVLGIALRNVMRDLDERIELPAYGSAPFGTQETVHHGAKTAVITRRVRKFDTSHS